MVVSPGEQRAVVLADWPQPATVSEPRVLADDTTLSLMYSTDDDRYAVIRFPLCTYLAFGAPNDEALGGHPLARVGLRHYAVHEVHGSALIWELERRNSVHPRHDPTSYLDRRHFVFTFQDSTLECVVPAEKWWTPSVAVYGRFEEAEVAWRATRQAEEQVRPPEATAMGMADWRTLSFQGCAVLARVAAVFEVGPPLPDPLPFASFTVKVLERGNGSFAAHLNVAVRGADGHPDWYAGLGDTPDEALADALDYFWRAVQERGASRAEDFVWAGCPEW